jgi:Na+/proline symporter
MKKTTIVAIILGLLVELPIWFYLLYWFISHSNPDRLVWFLFWIYVPTLIITTILSKIIGEDK